MKDIYQKTPEAVEAQVAEIWHAVKMVDDRPFNPGLIKTVLTQGVNSGQVNLFALECVASYPDASDLGVGKVVCGNEQIANYSTTVYAAPAISYLVDQLHEFGIKVNYQVFLGDDDFVYSVDQPWQSIVPGVTHLINDQVGWLEQNLPQEYHLIEGDQILVHKWTEIEQTDTQIGCTRQAIANYLQAAVKEEIKLAGPVQSRLESFIKWRKEIAKVSKAPVEESHLAALAVNELSSFATQGFWAPQINSQSININTFPGTAFADDLCMRLGQQRIFGTAVDFGTIHPCPVHLEGKLLSTNRGQSAKSKSGAVFTCGDPTGNPNF